MAIPRSLAERIASVPFDADTAHDLLSLTTSDASITLPPGAYDAWLDATATGYVRIGAAVSLPSSGTPTAVAGQFPIAAGGVVTFVQRSSAAVHAQLASGTGTLHFMRKL